jgi:hypothetical protein
MGKVVYGVDLSEKITPTIVRDALIRCFILAHKEIIDTMDEFTEWKSEKEREKFKNMQGEFVVEKAFDDAGVDFESPTKEGLIKVIDALMEYASNFRKPEIIKKHYGEIKQLIDKLD